MRVRTKVILVILLVSLGIFAASYVFLENIVLQLSEEDIDIINKNSGVGDDWQTESFYRELRKVNDKIAVAEILAKAGSGLGYRFLLSFVKNIDYCENVESTFQKAYKALGFIGRFDKRALRLLLSEFDPSADPVRAMNVLVGIGLTGNSTVLSECIEKILPFMSKEEVVARLGDKSVPGRGKIAVLK